MIKSIVTMACAAVLVVATMSSASAQAAPPTDTSPTTTTLPAGLHMDGGFIVYGNPSGAVSNGRIMTIQGVHEGNGCGFTEGALVKQGEPGVAEQELAYNPSSCQKRVLRGLPAADGANRPSAAVPCCRSGVQYITMAHVFTKYTDPPGYTVNSLTTWIQWLFNSSCVSSPRFTQNWYWLSNSGWTLDSSRDDHTQYCSQASHSDTADYSNIWFCHVPFAPTKVHYVWNTIVAYPDGSYYASSNSWKEGGCNNYLSEYWDAPRDY